jgi:hypothetical protein
MKKLFALLLLLLTPAPLAAQMGNVAEQREAMKKWDRWIGQWQGGGWIEYMPGQRMSYSINEVIQGRLGGTALLVEGRGKARMPGQQEESVIHESLATISYDDKAKKYRFVTHTEKGLFGMPEIKVTDDGGWQWGYRNPQGGGLLYTVKFTDKGEWFEYGERSEDGKTWNRFLEMTLKKVK